LIKASGILYMYPFMSSVGWAFFQLIRVSHSSVCEVFSLRWGSNSLKAISSRWVHRYPWSVFYIVKAPFWEPIWPFRLLIRIVLAVAHANCEKSL
jgi:hypothetical protein